MAFGLALTEPSAESDAAPPVFAADDEMEAVEDAANSGTAKVKIEFCFGITRCQGQDDPFEMSDKVTNVSADLS